MRSLMLIAALFVAGALALEDGQICEPGTTFKKDCNRCRCTIDGMKMACTKVLCAPKLQEDNPKVQSVAVEKLFKDTRNSGAKMQEGQVHTIGQVIEALALEDGQICEPGTTFKKDCNRCRCTIDGMKMACTKVLCAPKLQEDNPKVQSVAVEKLFKDTRNSGAKMQEGQVHTIGQVIEALALEDGQICEPGTSFNVDCNRCRCSIDGMKMGCTKALCASKMLADNPKVQLVAVEKLSKDTPLALKDGQICEPGTKFKLDCNLCACSKDGTKMGCTRAGCPRKLQEGNPKVQSVAVEKLSKDTWDSAAKMHAGHVHTNGQVCTPNEVKMEDCNQCKCAANGIEWFCTMKACPPLEERPTYAVDNRQKFDTSIDEERCVPGETFLNEDGCNNCFCPENGLVKHAGCTKVGCQLIPDNIPMLKIEPNTSGFTCKPRRYFKYQCNICFCGTSGKKAVCTKKICLPGDY